MKKSLLMCFVFFTSNIFASDEILKAEIMPKFEQALYLDVESNNTAIVAVGERGHVAISLDYGVSWEQSKNVPTRATLTAVSMVKNDVWAVGHDTTVIHSLDGGKNWELQFSDKERQMPLLDVLFVNESQGYAIGAYGTYLTTFDGGKTWDDSLLVEDQDFHLNKIIQIDNYNFFVVAEAGNAYRSLDAGKNWESLELPYPGSMFGAVSFNNQIITYGLRGNVLATADFGETFTQLKSPILDSLFGSVKTSDGKLLLVGANGAVIELMSNNRLKKINIKGSDGDYTQAVSVKNKLVIVGETGISTKLAGKDYE